MLIKFKNKNPKIYQILKNIQVSVMKIVRHICIFIKAQTIFFLKKKKDDITVYILKCTLFNLHYYKLSNL